MFQVEICFGKGERLSSVFRILNICIALLVMLNLISIWGLDQKDARSVSVEELFGIQEEID